MDLWKFGQREEIKQPEEVWAADKPFTGREPARVPLSPWYGMIGAQLAHEAAVQLGQMRASAEAQSRSVIDQRRNVGLYNHIVAQRGSMVFQGRPCRYCGRTRTTHKEKTCAGCGAPL